MAPAFKVCPLTDGLLHHPAAQTPERCILQQSTCQAFCEAACLLRQNAQGESLTTEARHIARRLSHDVMRLDLIEQQVLAVPSGLTGLLSSASSAACQHFVLCTTGSRSRRQHGAPTLASQGVSSLMLHPWHWLSRQDYLQIRAAAALVPSAGFYSLTCP